MRRGKIEIGVSIDNFGKIRADVNLNLEVAKAQPLTELSQSF